MMYDSPTTAIFKTDDDVGHLLLLLGASGCVCVCARRDELMMNCVSVDFVVLFFF